MRYICLDLDRKEFGNKYGYGFLLNTRFISNYFSRAIRRVKFETDGSFKMISIKGCIEVDETKIVPIDVMCVDLAFDKTQYQRVKGTVDNSYYLELLEKGFRKASHFKTIPLNALLDLIEEFKKGGCKNVWLHKKKRFKEDDIEVILTCEFTTNYFQLVATINQISTKKELVHGPILKTEPDEIVFEGMYKDIYLVNEYIAITDSFDNVRIVILKEDALNGSLNFAIVGDKATVKRLSYKLK